MPAVTFNLARTSRAQGWDYQTRDHDTLWEDFAAGYLYSRVAAPTTTYDSLRSSDPATRGRTDTFDASAGSLDLSAHNFAGAVSLDWSAGGSAAALRLDSPWGTIENLFISEFSGTTLTIENWVDVAVLLRSSRDLQISIDGAKRAEVVTGRGDDQIVVGLDSDGAAETNLVRVKASAGNDTITVGVATHDYNGAAYQPGWSKTKLYGGEGDDTIAGGPSTDWIYGDAGLDTVLLDGPRSAYDVTISARGVTVRDLRTGSARLDGTDLLTGVEFLRFSDETMTLPQDGFGVVSPPLDLGNAVVSDSPFYVTSSIDFLDNPYDASDFDELSPGAQTLLSGSPPQPLPQAMSFDILHRIANASLLKPGAEIAYDAAGATAEFLVEVDGIKIGVETVRAFAFPLESPYTLQQAEAILRAKLDDVLESTAHVSATDRWEKEILHIISINAQTTDMLTQAYAGLESTLKANTIVIVTQTEGEDHFLYS